MRTCTLLLILLTGISASCQSLTWINTSAGDLAIIQSSHAPFPHPDRQAGHRYGDSLYTFEEHYQDSSVAIFIPHHFKATGTIDLVFYFHGWGNNIQSSLERFHLLEQFSGSRKNAIFVFPQGPRNSKDSFGGRLEDPRVFKALVEEILGRLKQDGRIRSQKPGKIILAGHSGAYHVIAYILNRGGLADHISEVYLFDALYGELEKFTHWLKAYDGRLVNFVTPNGGTLANSLDLLEDLGDWGISFKAYEQNSVSLEELSAAKVVTVFTGLGHSEVVDPFFGLALGSSQLKTRN